MFALGGNRSGRDFGDNGELIEVVKVGDEGIKGVDADSTGFLVRFFALVLNSISAFNGVGAFENRC